MHRDDWGFEGVLLAEHLDHRESADIVDENRSETEFNERRSWRH